MAASSGDLPTLMKDRRLALGLSVSAAAKIADVDRATWSKWEKGTAKPFDSNYVNIERALQWPPRQVSGILNGRITGDDDTPSPVPDGIVVDPADWAAMTTPEREQYVRIVTGVRRRRQGARGA